MTLSPGSARAAGRLQQIRESRLLRQNLVLFAGGLVAGLGGFVYHAVAARLLGPARYGEVALLVALYAVGGTVNLILILVLARYAATLQARGSSSGLRYLITRSMVVLGPPAAVWIALSVALAVPAAAFEHLGSPVPVIWLGLAVAVFWYAAVPRGLLQGIQRFTGLSANLSLEMVMRTGFLVLLLKAGLAVTGAMVAVLLGIGVAFGAGMWSLRDVLAIHGERVPLRSMAGFAITAAAGTLGVLLLYNLDVILAKHYLSGHDAGIYGALNKIGTILYFLTLSISQVLFPRVVEAVHRNAHPGRLLLLSAVIMTALGACALAVFGVLPQVVVLLLLGARFSDAIPFVFRIGAVGLAIALVNLLVQFLMAVHDRIFVVILAGGCALLAGSIVVFHDGVGSVVGDVLVSNLCLLGALALRAVLLLPRLTPEMVAESGEAEPA